MKTKQSSGTVSVPDMSFEVQELHLPLEPVAPEEIDFSDIVRKIVAVKYAVDVALHGEGPMPDDFAKNWPQEWPIQANTISPDDFVFKVIPFLAPRMNLPLLQSPGPLVSYVDPHCVVGQSWRHWPPQLSEENKNDFIANTDDQVQQCIREGQWGHHACMEHPHFTEVSPFGLYVADGGKNRIAVYQERNRLVGAHVHARIHFPEARRIALHSFGDGELEAILDRRHRVTLRYAAGLISDLLVRYGAEID